MAEYEVWEQCVFVPEKCWAGDVVEQEQLAETLNRERPQKLVLICQIVLQMQYIAFH